MKLSILTPTCNRQRGLDLLYQMVLRQTVLPDEWVIADGGNGSISLNVGQKWVHTVGNPPGAVNFTSNVINGLKAVTGDVLVVMEDDDWYAPTHLERMVELLESSPETLAAGDDLQRYYNLPNRLYRTFDNVGASLCQTALRRSAIPLLTEVAEACRTRRSYGVDTTFWRAIDTSRWAIARLGTVVGIKGLEGQAGLGIGHRPSGPWERDDDGYVLRSWVGEEFAQIYGVGRSPTAV